MANTVISLRSSGVTGNTPSLGVLANGELSLNFADGILYYKTSANTLGSIYRTPPAGLNQEIQFNDSGSFGANASLTFNKSTGYFTAPIIESSNNGTGTNFKVGDDAWIGDINQSDTLLIKGQQDGTKGYIVFGSSDTSKLGRSGTGALTYTGAFTATGTVSGLELSSTQSSGDEGGQVNLAIPATNTTLTGQVTIDVYQNKLRFFQGDSAKGAYIDLTAASAGVGTNLLAGASGVTSVAGATGTVSNNQILSGILTVDGAGSGLDADLLDGLNSSSFANAAFANTDYTTISATAGVYGNATHVPVVTLSANGRISSITNTAISPVGLNQEIQFNDSGSLGANASLTFNKTIATLNVTNINTSSLVTGSGSGGVISGANVVYSNTFVANTGGYFQFADGTKQYTANADGAFAQAAFDKANSANVLAQSAYNQANTDYTTISATAGVYGNATHVPIVTLSANGRISSITNTAISGIASSNSFGVIYTSNNTTYANATSSTDQLNFVGESGIVAWANSLTKTITIAGTPGAQGLTVDYGYVYEAMNYSIDYGTL